MYSEFSTTDERDRGFLPTYAMTLFHGYRLISVLLYFSRLVLNLCGRRLSNLDNVTCSLIASQGWPRGSIRYYYEH